MKLLFILESELQKTTASQNAKNWPYQGVQPQLIWVRHNSCNQDTEYIVEVGELQDLPLSVDMRICS